MATRNNDAKLAPFPLESNWGANDIVGSFSHKELNINSR